MVDTSMAKVSNLVLSASEEFVLDVRDLCELLDVSIADVVRGAVRARLDDPPPFDFENTSGPRVHGLRVHVDPKLKKEIEAAAEAQGLSIARWLETAIASHLMGMLAQEEARAEERRTNVHKAAMIFRGSLKCTDARPASPAHRAKRERMLERVREKEERVRIFARGMEAEGIG